MAQQVDANSFDILFLGGGTGYYVAAIRAAQLGMRVGVVEKDKIGGTCTHRGCIPAKALLKSASVARWCAGRPISASPPRRDLDYGQAARRSRKVVDQSYKGIQYLFKKHKIEVIEGSALTAPTTIQVETAGGPRTLSARDIVIDTGSTPARSRASNRRQDRLHQRPRHDRGVPAEAGHHPRLGRPAWSSPASTASSTARSRWSAGSRRTRTPTSPAISPAPSSARRSASSRMCARRPTTSTSRRQRDATGDDRRQGRRSRPTLCCSPSGATAT
jgi:hypothetical protein